MAWFTDRHLFLLAVSVYGVCMAHAVFLWRKGFRQHDRASFGLLLVGFLLHTGTMVLRGFSLNRCPVNNLFEATIFLASANAHGSCSGVTAWRAMGTPGPYISVSAFE